MILPWPLTRSTELAQMLRPGSDLRPDSALRALRDKGDAAESISVVPRSSRGAHGRSVWYSALMLDVARLVRVDEPAAARALHGAAHRLASHRAARVVAEALLLAGSEPDPAGLDTETGGALSRLALLTESARRKHVSSLGVETVTGRISDVSPRSITLTAHDGTQLTLPHSSRHATHGVGSLVSIDIEPFVGGNTTIWVRAAFDSDADPNERRPAGVHLLSPAERERLGPPVPVTR